MAGTHSLCRSWKGAELLSVTLSSLSLFISRGYMELGSIFTEEERDPLKPETAPEPHPLALSPALPKDQSHCTMG